MRISSIIAKHWKDLGNELAIGVIFVVASVISAFLIGTIWIKAYTFWGGHGFAVVTPFVGLLYGAFFIIKGLIKLDKRSA